jgi:hypothetical protein
MFGIGVRHNSAGRILTLGSEFETTAQKITLFDDPMIETFRKRLEDLNHGVIDETKVIIIGGLSIA